MLFYDVVRGGYLHAVSDNETYGPGHRKLMMDSAAAAARENSAIAISPRMRRRWRTRPARLRRNAGVEVTTYRTDGAIRGRIAIDRRRECGIVGVNVRFRGPECVENAICCRAATGPSVRELRMSPRYLRDRPATEYLFAAPIRRCGR